MTTYHGSQHESHQGDVRNQKSCSRGTQGERRAIGGAETKRALCMITPIYASASALAWIAASITTLAA